MEGQSLTAGWVNNGFVIGIHESTVWAKCRVYGVKRGDIHFCLEVCHLWDITQRRVVVLYRRFGTKYRSHFPRVKTSKIDPWKMGQIGCPRNVGTEMPLDVA